MRKSVAAIDSGQLFDSNVPEGHYLRRSIVQLKTDRTLSHFTGDLLIRFNVCERNSVHPRSDSGTLAANYQIVETSLPEDLLDPWLELLLSISVEQLAPTALLVNPTPAKDTHVDLVAHEYLRRS